MVSAAVSEFTKKSISGTPVFIASKSYCPYCNATKELLFKTLGLKPTDEKINVIELNERDDGAEIQEELEKISGQRTVPNIFIGGKHIGGNSDIQALHKSGKLVPLLKEVNVL